MADRPREETSPLSGGPGNGEEPSGTDQDPAARKLLELERQVEQCRDQLLRKAAEFENYKRRSENDIAAVIRNANESLVGALLPVLDDFARSLKPGTDGDPESFRRGIEMIHAKLLKILESRGLQAFASKGEPFNVELHDALMQVPRKDVPPHTVVEEVERGYRFNDRVIRHARVVVSSAPGEGTPDGDDDGGTDA
jgi:molecular chaperone GrpE